MQKIYFTPGPTQLYPQIKTYIDEAIKNDICSISHRGKEFEQIFQNTISSLKRLLDIPPSFKIFFLGSGTEAMERVIENCVEQHSYHFVNGAFSKRFYQTAQELKKSPQKFEVAAGQGFDFSAANIPSNTELACFTQNETSTGAAIPMHYIYELKKKHPDMLFALDIVSSAPYVNTNYSMVDSAFFSVQKGYGMPAGLGVIIVHDKVIEKSKTLQNKNLNIGSYHSFPSLLKSAEKSQTPETPNVLGIYLLGRICDDLCKIGIEKIRSETEKKAQILYDFFESNQDYEVFVKDKKFRSNTIIVINTPNGSQPTLKKLSEHGFIVGSGYKEFKEKQIRIANFPMHKIEDVKRMLKII